MSVGPLKETLRHTYQRALVEHVQDVQNLIPQVWSDLLKSSKLENLLLSACPYFGTWLALAMQPARFPIDPFCLLSASQGQVSTRFFCEFGKSVTKFGFIFFKSLGIFLFKYELLNLFI